MLPFQLEPKTVSDTRIEEINFEEMRLGENAFGSTEGEIKLIRFAQKIDLDRLDRWVHHPAEEVPLELLGRARKKNWLLKFLSQDVSGSVDVLWKRAVSTAKTEGVFWTPLLDSFISLKAIREDSRVREAKKFLSDAGEWVEASASTEDIQALYEVFHAAPFERMLLRRAKEVPAPWALGEIHKNSGLATALAQNNYLSQEDKEALRDWAVESLASATTEAGEDRDLVGKSARKTFETLVGRGVSIPAGARGTLLKEAKEGIGGPDHKWLVQNVLSSVVKIPDLKSSEINSLAKVSHADPEALKFLLGYENTPTDVAIRVVQGYPTEETLKVISAKHDWRFNAQIRPTLLKAMHGDIVKNMLQDMPEQEVEAYLRRLARVKGMLFLEAFEKDWVREDIKLNPRIFEHALSDVRREVRLRAVSLLSKLKKSGRV